jgi:hypothetical protein
VNAFHFPSAAVIGFVLSEAHGFSSFSPCSNTLSLVLSDPSHLSFDLVLPPNFEKILIRRFDRFNSEF